MAEPMTAIPEALYEQLQNEKLILLHTLDAETNVPTSSAISWIYAVSPEKLRFALDQRSRLVGNIKQHPHVTFTIFGAGTVHAVTGKAKLVADALEEVPFKLTCFEVQVEHVREAMFYGGRITTEPEYEKTYDQRAAERLDNQVFAAMKKA